jgi:hypothetical protein
VKDSSETDVDCGGLCSPCDDGKHCLVGDDCVNGICAGADAGAEGTCALPTCGDGVQNGNETDVDCGGSAYTEPSGGPDAGPFTACPPCADTKGCNVDTDCVSLDCVGGVCTPKALGAPCTTSAECNTGNGNACVPDDTNPDNGICCATSCTAASAASCGNDGNCKHNGSACADYSNKTPCVVSSCNGTVLTKATDCNGSGTCPTAPTVDCSTTSQVCNAGKNACVQCNADATCSGSTPACNTSTNTCVQCTSTNTTQCTGSQTCVNNTCQ